MQELKPEAEELQARAVTAWEHYHRAPKSSQCDEQKIKAGDADLSLEQQAGLSVVAAVYLFALTREPAYASYIRAHMNAAQPFGPGGWNGYRPAEGEALVFYATLSEADPAVRSAIIERKLGDLATRRDLYGFYPERDLYRSYLPDQAYHWGSNRVRAQIGSINLELAQAPFAIEDDSYRTRALTALQYLHGVNPLGVVYLSNMYALGAERSVNEIFHGWFADGTAFDNALTSACGPPPGYLVGGPNAAYSGPLSPPRRQPRKKRIGTGTGAGPIGPGKSPSHRSRTKRATSNCCRNSSTDTRHVCRILFGDRRRDRSPHPAHDARRNTRGNDAGGCRGPRRCRRR